MYNLIKYSSNYSEIIGVLWFYSKDEGANFNADIANDNSFKSFKYKAKLLINAKVDGALTTAKIAMSLEYLSNFGDHLKCH